MKKLLVSILLIAIVFIVSCQTSNIEVGQEEQNTPVLEENSNENVNNKSDNINNEDILNNKSPNQVNGGNFDSDKNSIFYIKDQKLFSIGKDGSNKKTLVDTLMIRKIFLQNNRIYLLCQSIEKSKSELWSVNKDGTDLKQIQMSEMANSHLIYSFAIKNNDLYFAVHREDLLYDGMNPQQELYKYNLETKEEIIIFENLFSNMFFVTYDNKLYYFEGEKLLEYNMETDDKRSITINKNVSNEQIFSVQLRDEYIYYNGKDYISREKLYEEAEKEVLLENKDFLINTINVTDEYIFFINRIHDSNQEYTHLQVYRMKHDGSELKEIYSEKMDFFHLSIQNLYVVDDKLIYSNSRTNKAIVMDFDGNLFNWEL